MRLTSSLNTGWTASGGPVKNPIPARVPGHIHLDLMRSGVIPDPFLHQYEAGVQWVDTTDWTYTKSFDFHPNSNLPIREITFDGLDTIATIKLNGKIVCESENMFVPLTLDVSAHLKEGTNTIEVFFESNVNAGNRFRNEYFKNEGINPLVKGFDERAFVRKAQYMSGWDWGPRLVSCGIWKPVTFIERTADDVLLLPAAAKPIAQLVQTPDQFGKSFEFQVDGRKFWIRGANWIPNHSFPSLCTRSQIRDTLLRCQDMNFNMLRIWGGGLYESDDFYEICADLDILVWQDFLFGCSYYPENDSFLKNVEKETITAIERLRQYPNLVLWCGNNENHTMWHDGWQKGDERPLRYYGQRIYEELLPELVKTYDPDRPYIASSPIGGPSPNSDQEGDVHCWDVWHGRGDWRFYGDSKARFCSEFGFASCPTMATWEDTLGDTNRKHDDPEVRWHDKTAKPYHLYTGMVELHYPHSESLEDWTYYSQLNQRDAMRFGIEHYRRSDFCSGTLIWQINDCWPVQSWAILDSNDRPKAVAYELKRLYDDVLLSFVREKADLSIFAMNDGIAEVSADLELVACNLTSKSIMRQESVRLSIAPGVRKSILTINLSGLNVSETLIIAKAGPYSTWTLLNDPKSVRFGKAESIEAESDGDLLKLKINQPVVDLRVSVDGDTAPFLVNFLTQGRAGTIEIPLARSIDVEQLELRSLAGKHHITL